MISDSPAYLLLVFDMSERFSIEAILWVAMVIGRKLRKLRKLKNKELEWAVHARHAVEPERSRGPI
jgi:hypothetical protein